MIDLKFAQDILFDWGVRCFGVRHMANRYKRSLRCFEEVVEWMQANEVPQEKLVDVIKVVYGKKPGTFHEEAGHALGSALMLMQTQGIDSEEVLKTTILVALNRDPVKLMERNAEKDALGL